MTEHDDELAQALGRSVSTIPVGETDAALARVTARSRVVRRRRVAVRAGAALAAAAAVGAVWLGARPPGSTQVDTVDSPSTASAPSTGGTTTDVGPASSTASSTATSAPSSTAASSPSTTAPAAVTTAPAPAPPSPTAGSAAPPGATAAPTTARPPPSSGLSTYGGAGGQVTVRVDAGTLVLVSVRPSAGFAAAEQKVGPGEVEVRFEGAAGRTRVRIRLEDGGTLSSEVREG